MEVVKTDYIKDDATNIDGSSEGKIRCCIDCMEQMTCRCVMPAHKLDLELVKYQENVERETITSHDAEMSIKTEINDMKFEAAIEECESVYKEMKSIKIENGKEVPGNEFVEHTIDGVEVDVEKQNAVDHCQRSSYEDVARHSKLKYKEITKREMITSYNREMSIKTEINIIKYEGDIEEYGLDHEELKSLKVENCKIDPGNEYVEPTSNCSEVARNSKHENNIELHQSLSFASKGKPSLQVQFKEFHCSLCDFKTKYKHNFLQHYRLKHDESIEIFHCKLCYFKTKHKKYLLQHHILKHDDSAKIFHCELCDYETKNKRTLLVHHRMKHDDAARIFHCAVCDFKTKTKQCLLQHHRLKHDDSAEIFHCDLCGFKTKLKNHFLKHHKLKHDDSAEIFHCELCGFKTKLRNTMLQHHAAKHDSSAKIFCCEQCQFQTKHKNSLLRHHRLKHDK